MEEGGSGETRAWQLHSLRLGCQLDFSIFVGKIAHLKEPRPYLFVDY